MLIKKHILDNLKSLEKEYNSARSQKHALFFSKLALLELCGWIEESMDDIVVMCSQRKVKGEDNRKYVSKEIVKRVYSFEYDVHFRNMLMRLIGMINIERLEQAADPGKIARLQAALGLLKKSRDAEAHSHIKGVTRTINAPSHTLAQWQQVYDGLKEIDRVVRQMTL